MELLENFLHQWGLDISGGVIERFCLLRDELKLYNKKINLTAIVSDEEIEMKHFIDSLYAIKCGIKNEGSLLDVGSGAGFPAIPLAIVFPGLKVSACEATSKKAMFISYISEKLKLRNLTVYPLRSEELPLELRESFDWATARALAKPTPSFEMLFPWISVGGKAILYTTENFCFDEKILSALRRFGGPLNDDERKNSIEEYVYELSPAVPTSAIKGDSPSGKTIARKIISVTKLRPTPRDYPRRPGIATRKPVF